MAVIDNEAMPLEVRLKPFETLLFRSDSVAVGKFRCPASHPLFRDSGPCSHHTFVFPRTVTAIRFDGGPKFVATPNSVVFYNQDQLYTRSKISELDASDWFTIADDLLGELLSTDDLRRPFRAVQGAVDATTFLMQRRLFDSVDCDALEVEERVLGILRRIVPRTQWGAGAPPARTGEGAGAPPRSTAVERTKAMIAANPASNLSLRDLSRAAGVSPFQLCRAFRTSTGQTLTRFRHELRLRLALDRLRDPHQDLTDLALDLGYASHSHFTARFRRHFGVVPSALRART